MRTNRARLVEWLADMLFEASGADQSEYRALINAYESQAATWADSIMDDINKGIIAPDKDQHEPPLHTS